MNQKERDDLILEIVTEIRFNKLIVTNKILELEERIKKLEGENG